MLKLLGIFAYGVVPAVPSIDDNYVPLRFRQERALTLFVAETLFALVAAGIVSYILFTKGVRIRFRIMGFIVIFVLAFALAIVLFDLFG